MRKNKSKLLRGLGLIAIIIISIILYSTNFNKDKGLRITKWNNTYNENNITLFYEDISKVKDLKVINQFNSIYKVDELLISEKTEMDKVLKGIELLNDIVYYDDVNDSMSSDAYGILKEKVEKKKVSGRDMSIIARDILLSTGIQCRIGEFRKTTPQFESKPSYYVIEYWSTDYNKWVMVDFIDKGYVERDKVPQSAIEVIESNFKDCIYIGTSAQNKYKGKLKKYFGSYTINIDNTIAMKKSNSYLTYYTDESAIDLKSDGKFIPATIYTTERNLFIKSPSNGVDGTDKNAYIIMMKKPMESNEDYTYVVGGFKDGKVMRDYYIRINGSEVKKIDMYEDIIFEVGKTTIELSLDGQNITTSVEITRDK